MLFLRRIFTCLLALLLAGPAAALTPPTEDDILRDFM